MTALILLYNGFKDSILAADFVKWDHYLLLFEKFDIYYVS